MASLFAPIRARALEAAAACATTTSSSIITLPSFLVPAAAAAAAHHHHNRHHQRRLFSATAARPSKLGRTPLSIPPDVNILVSEPIVMKDATSWKATVKRTVTVTGPLGTLQHDIPPFVKLDVDTKGRQVVMSVENSEEKKQKEMWGTTWAYINNHVMGVSEGHTAILRLVGIGYRATMEERPDKAEYAGQQFVCLKLGFSHPVEMGLPKGMKGSTPQPTRILLEGIDKVELLSFAARIRRWRTPEPYKGKGIFVNDETIKLKQKKIK